MQKLGYVMQLLPLDFTCKMEIIGLSSGLLKSYNLNLHFGKSSYKLSFFYKVMSLGTKENAFIANSQSFAVSEIYLDIL